MIRDHGIGLIERGESCLTFQPPPRKAQQDRRQHELQTSLPRQEESSYQQHHLAREPQLLYSD